MDTQVMFIFILYDVQYPQKFVFSFLKGCSSSVSIHPVKKFPSVKVWIPSPYIERFISTVSCFFSYVCWSVNCMSWVNKWNNFFLTCTETEARFMFEGFNIVLYEKFISDCLIHFLFFFTWSVNCLRDLLSHIVSQ